MGSLEAEIAATAHRATAELRRIDLALERIVADVDDPHLAGRIHEAAVRIQPVVRSLELELDKANPHLGWLRRNLTSGSLAVGLLAGVLTNNVSERVDLIDLAEPVLDALPGVVHDAEAGQDLVDALRAFEVERRRFTDLDDIVTVDGDPLTVDGEPLTVDRYGGDGWDEEPSSETGPGDRGAGRR